jgi:hypothetical protein
MNYKFLHLTVQGDRARLSLSGLKNSAPLRGPQARILFPPSFSAHVRSKGGPPSLIQEVRERFMVQMMVTQGAHMGLKGKPVKYRRGPATVNKEQPLARPLGDQPGKDSGVAIKCHL